MKQLENQNYRVCYDNGNSTTGTKIYEMNKYCDCQDCKKRTAWKREPVNQVTVTTREFSKIDEIADFLKNWTCINGTRQLERTFLKL